MRKFKVTGKYKGTYPQLRSGMMCRATIRANSVPDCLQVPVLAVFREGEEHFCWVDGPDGRAKRLVKIGAANDSRVEIIEGLRKGETVILLRSGEPVGMADDAKRTSTLIELDGVRKTYHMPAEDVHALRDVTLAIDKGDFVSVVGSSGSGKTTLLYLLGMLTDPSEGAYRFDGQDVASMTDAERSALRGRSIGFIFQAFHLLPQLTVLDNVLLPRRYARGDVDRDNLADRARR